MEAVSKPPLEELQALIDRLERDYRDRFVAAGAVGFDAWASPAKVGVEAYFDRSGGAAWLMSVRYAVRRGWRGLFGPFVAFKTLQDVERELRVELDAYLAKLQTGYRPRLFR
jgi:hypothetical protein